MLMITAIFVPMTVVMACLLLLYASNRSCKQNLPPGPYNLPFIGNLHRLGKLPHRSLHKLSRAHGPLIYLKLGTVPTIVVSSAKIAEDFLKTHDLECCSRPALVNLEKLSYSFNDMAFCPYGDKWKEVRKRCIMQLFSSQKVASYQYVREEEVERMVSSISRTCYNDEPVNLTEELVSLANSVTCRTAMGKRYYTDGGRLGDMLRESQAVLNGFFFANYMPMLGWLDVLTGMRARLERSFRELDGYYQKVIDEHMDPMRMRMRRQDEKDDGGDAIDAMLDMQMKGGLDNVKGILMNIFIAGTDTYSTAIEWAMAELMRNQESKRKAQQEVRALIGISRAKVEETDLPHLHYLKSVVKETLRMHPPVPALVQRETMQHFKANGYDIPPNARLFVNAWAIGRDGDVWEKPDEFNPERFRDSPIDFKGQDFELIPFGAGRRMCPGMASGIALVEIALANLLHCFDWELPKGMTEEDIDMDESPGIIVHKKCPLQLVARRVGRTG